MHTKTKFEETLQSEVQVKNMPNAQFYDDRFTFGDYFDTEAFRESFDGDIDDIDAWVDYAFAPLELYLSGVDEISFSRSNEDMVFFDVMVDIPEDTERQTLLAQLVADAWERRCQR